MRIFDYIFYRITFFYKRRRDLSPETAASLIVSLLQFFSILDLFIIVRVFYEHDIPAGFNKVWALPFIVILGLFNWYIYERTPRYQELRKIWKDEDERQRRKRGVLIILSLIILLIIPVLYGLIRQNVIAGRSFFS
jgi:accessory gene regulator protein AgrB